MEDVRRRDAPRRVKRVTWERIVGLNLRKIMKAKEKNDNYLMGRSFLMGMVRRRDEKSNTDRLVQDQY